MTDLEYCVRAILTKRYPNYDDLPNGERVLLAMSILARDIKVREVGGNNRGRFVNDILASVAAEVGSPWCAAAIKFCFQVAGVRMGPNRKSAAAVLKWLEWARTSGRLRSVPMRGRLCVRVMVSKRAGGKLVQDRHIGIVSEIIPSSGNVISYEGNTSSGDAGSQNDGGGLFRRARNLSYWTSFVDINESAV